MKKLLLSIVPVLMLLGSCAGAQPKAELKLFEDSTALDNDLFGSEEISFKKAPRNAGKPDSSKPTLGVQSKIDAVNNLISIRFIAGIKFANEEAVRAASAVWTRSMYKDDGDVFSKVPENTFPSTTAYTSLIANGKPYTIAQFNAACGGTEYTHFVTYTMKNIPFTKGTPGTYDGYYLNAYLTVNKDDPSVVLSTTVDQAKQAAFPLGKTGYFLAGKIGELKTVDADEETILSSVNKASFTVDLTAGDYFSVVHNDNNKFEIYGYSNTDGDQVSSHLDRVPEKEIISVTTSGLKYIFLRNDLKIYPDIERYFVVGTISGANHWSFANGYELYESANDGEYLLPSAIPMYNEDLIKVTNHDGTVWMPESYDDDDHNYEIDTQYGNYQVHFFPKHGSGEGAGIKWSVDNWFYAELKNELTPTTKTIQLDVGVWDSTGNPRYYAWVWGGETGSNWVDCTSTSITIDSGATKMILLRGVPTGGHGWGKDTDYWNKTNDVAIVDGKKFHITGWGESDYEWIDVE